MAIVNGANNVTDTLTSMFKESYDSAYLKAWPDFAYVLKKTKFTGAAAGTGGKFVQPILLTREHGWVSATSGTTMGLSGGVPMTTTRAELVGSQLVGQGLLDYEAAARAQKDKASFVDATALLVENLMDSGGFRLEHQFLYGQSGIAVASAGTATTFTVAAADWCPAMWAGLEGAHLAQYTSGGAFITGGHVTITSIDYATRIVTTSAPTTAWASGHIIGFRNSWTGNSALTNEMKGLESILTEATSLYNISLSTYPSLKGNTSNVGGPLTISNLLSGLLLAVNRGLRKNVTVLVSPAGWQNLINPVVDPKAQAANTNMKVGTVVTKNVNGTKVDFGVDGITIHIQNGTKAEIIPHMLVREGDAFAIPLESVRRVGAQELSFTTPGRSDEIFLHSASYGAYELRCYANQALYVEKPNQCVLFNGIS